MEACCHAVTGVMVFRAVPIAGGWLLWHIAGMIEDRGNSRPDPALLILADKPEVRVNSEAELREALMALSSFRSGQTVYLSRGAKHYIQATREGEFWAVVTRYGGWWTLASFTAGMTTDYSARQVRKSRAAGSVWRRISAWITAPPVEHALSSGQVVTIFVEYFLGKAFSIPRSGA